MSSALVRSTVLIPGLVLLAAATPAQRTVRVDTVDELRAALAAAVPGTEILIAPGTYRGNLHSSELRGAAGRPVVIAAADPDEPPLFRGGSVGIHLTDPAWIELRDLSFAGATGNGLNIDDAGSFDTPAHHVVLRRLRVRDVGPDGNCDGIKMSGVNGFEIDSCTVSQWGSGGSGVDLVGCHDGVIESCVFRHRPGVGGSGVQAKGGSSGVVIRRCRFEHAGQRGVNLGGSTGLQFFRPKAQGYEAKAVTVEGCTFIGSAAPVAFVGIDGALVRHNTIYRPGRWVVRILQETKAKGFVPSRNGRFEDNLVVFRSDELSRAVNVGPHTAPLTFSFARNFWYCVDRPGRSEPQLPTEERGGVYGDDPLLRDPEKGDLRLGEDSPARAAGAGALQ